MLSLNLRKVQRKGMAFLGHIYTHSRQGTIIIRSIYGLWENKCAVKYVSSSSPSSPGMQSKLRVMFIPRGKMRKGTTLNKGYPIA